MNTSGHLQILCALLLAFQGVFCNEFDKREYLRSINGRDEISSGDFFKFFWRNSKQRRSVNSAGEGQLKTADPEQTPQEKPEYECGDRVLAVVLKHADNSNIFIYGPRGDMLHLGLLAAFCGVSIKTTQTDVRLLFNYDSCYVKQVANQNVLSMNWYGTDIELSCPVSVTPPSVTCKDNAMELTVGDGTADELFVALTGKEAPLLFVATQCWHRESSKQGELTFSVPYTSCGVSFRDGRVIVDLRSKDKLMPLSCPYGTEPEFPVSDSGFPVKGQLPSQKQPIVYHKPPSVFPSKIIASQTVKQEHAFPVNQQGQNAARTPFLQPRAHWLPKLPALPGTFNLSVNFPFSVPIPKQPEHHRHHWPHKHVAPTPEPAPEPTPTPTFSSFTEGLEPSFEIEQPLTDSNGDYEQTEQEIIAAVTETPESLESPQAQYSYMQHPYSFQKPTSSSSQSELFPAYQYQLSRTPFPSTELHQPFGLAHSYNFPRHDAHHVKHTLATLAQYLPPGYFICPIHNHQPPAPQMFQAPVLYPSQPSHHQKPSHQKLDITPYGPDIPAAPPIKAYSEERPTSAVAFGPHHHHRPHHHPSTPHSQPTRQFQPSQYQPYFYQSSHGRHGSTTTSLSPTSHLGPIHLQSQARPLSLSIPLQDSRPFHSQFYQKPSQSSEPVQQPWSTGYLPVKLVPQESRPSSSHIPEHFHHHTGGHQSLDPDQWSAVQTPGTGISSHSQYKPSQFSPLRPEVFSAYENSGSGSKGFFQPRSFAQVPSLKTLSFRGNRPAKSVLYPFLGKQGAQVPYSQGPSIGYTGNPYVHSERQSEPNHQQRPIDDTP